MEQQLETARRQLERRVRELEARDHMVRLQTSGPTLEQARIETLQALAQALDVRHLHLWWPGPDARGLCLVAAHGASAPAPTSPPELAVRAFQDGRLQECADQGEAAVPILYRDAALGVLWVHGLGSQAWPWDDAVQVLQRLAQQAALVLRMAHLTEDLDSGKIQVADLLELEAEEGDGPT
jgi:GAF domain-containing protein